MSATDVLVVDLAKEDETLKLYPHAALLSSHRAGWNEVQLKYHQQPPHQVPENCSKQHRIIIHTQSLPSHLVEQMNQNRFQTEQPGDGAITVIPANINNWAYWDKERQFMFSYTTIANWLFLLGSLLFIPFNLLCRLLVSFLLAA